jgi:hypothetical protein
VTTTHHHHHHPDSLAFPFARAESVPDVNMVLKPLKICIDYKLAILILMDIDTLNKHPPQTPGREYAP